MTVLVELAGLEVRGRHGAMPEEHERDQPFLFDLELELPEPQADRLEETVDYREVVELVREVSASRELHLLETLAATVADALALVEVDPSTRGVAVAVDAEVVPRAAWPELALSEGAQVEVVGAIQGG